MPSTSFQPSFAAGELSPELGHRTDLAKYAVGAATIKNMYVLPRGGLRSRTGTKYIATTKNSANQSRLVEFIFSTTQAYMLEFGDYYIRFYKDGGQIVDGDDTPYEIATPYPLADIWLLKFEQSADTLFIVHNNHAPRKLTRTGHTAWTLSQCEFKNGPLMKENDTDTTITLTSTNEWILEDEAVTATASAALFNANHVGSVWGVRTMLFAATYEFPITAYTDFTGESYRVFGDWEVNIDPGSDKIDSLSIFIQKSIDDKTSWFTIKTIPPTSDTSSITITGSETEPCHIRVTRPGSAGDSAYITVNVKGKMSWSCFKITGYTSPTVVTGKMQNDYNKGGTALKAWAEGAWSDNYGWPGSIAFFQNRLVFAGSKNEPNAYWMSVIDDYENIEKEIPQVEDNAIQNRLVGRSVNAIEWLVPVKALVLLTDTSEWTVQPGSNGTLAYNSLRQDQQTYWGANGQVEPVILGNAVVFAQREGGFVRSIGYDYSIDGYTGNDLSVMAHHLFDGYTIMDWSYQQTPNSILWAVRSDGVLLSFTFHKEHDVWAWAQHHTDGQFESVAVIPGEGQDDVYFIVKRTINGQTKRYVETLAHRDISSKTNFFGIDCGATYEGAATTTISGLDWLEGKQVSVLADGLPYKTTVSSGSITLTKAASKVHVGLGFEWLFKSLQVDFGNTTDRKKVVSGITVSVISSQGGTVSTEDDGAFVPLPYPSTNLYSGDLVDIPLTTGWDYKGQVVIKGSGILPMHITTIMPQVTIGGK